ncbi:hypothetical protein [Allomuricauda sp. M10]|uniref:hypothetical protein n=1 Tax=Allomuricauda sp. M10 TaxID=2683292 RepID=UPI001D190E48|nr:hypothetical protein [Muricauda sp. M10]
MNIFSKTIKIQPVLLTVLATMLFFTVNSRAQGASSPETLLIGSWIFAQAPSFSSMDQEDRELMESSPQLKASVQTSYLNRILTFSSNGLFSQTDRSGKTLEGTWSLQGQTLNIQSASGSIWTLLVVSLGPDQLVVQQSAKGEARPILPVIYFTKNQ